MLLRVTHDTSPNRAEKAPDDDHHAAVLRKLERLRGHKLTYVDASSLVFLSQLRISDVWSVDQDLAIEGARVVPRSA